MTMPATVAWYVVFTRPKNESVAVENLENQGFAAYLPMASVKKRRASGTLLVVEPLFPRYVFVALTKGVHNFSKIRSTRGCVDLVRFGFEVVHLPLGFVESLRAAENEDGLIDLQASRQLEQGTRVSLQNGPFEGLVGELRNYKSADRVVIMLDLMGKKTAVEVAADSVEKV